MSPPHLKRAVIVTIWVAGLMVASCDDTTEPPGDLFIEIRHDADGDRAPHGTKLTLGAYPFDYEGPIICSWTLDEPYNSEPSLMKIAPQDFLRCDLVVVLPDREPGSDTTPLSLPDPLDFEVFVTATETGASGSAVVRIEVTNSAPTAILTLEPDGSSPGDVATLRPGLSYVLDTGASIDAEGDPLTTTFVGDLLEGGCGQGVVVSDQSAGALSLFLPPWEQPPERCELEVTVTDPYGASGSTSIGLDLDFGTADEARPNIVMIILNEIGLGSLGSFGSEIIETPNLDALADEGLRFTRLLTHPGSAAARAALSTGRWPQRFGLVGELNLETSMRGLPTWAETLAEALGRRGYHTATYGSWPLGRNRPIHLPDQQGYQEYSIYYTSHYTNPTFQITGGDLYTLEGRSDEVLTDLVVDLLSRPLTEPLYLEVSYLAARAPYNAPPWWITHYQDLLGPDALNEEELAYAALVSSVDEQIGRVLEAIDAQGLGEETIVVVVSDSGGPALGALSPNGDFRGGSLSLEEGGLRVPMILRWPGRLPEGLELDEVTSILDLAPTLATAAGAQGSIEPPDGRDLIAPLLFSEPLEPPTLFWELRRSPLAFARDTGGFDDLAILQGDQKLLITGDLTPGAPEQTLLFDLLADPFETTDLAEGHPEVVAALGQLLSDWRLEVTQIDQVVAETTGGAVVEGDTYSFETPGSVELERDSLFDFHDGDLTFTTIVENSETSASSQVLVELPGSFTLERIPDGGYRLELRSGSGGQVILGAVGPAAGVRHRLSVTFAGWNDSGSQVRILIDGEERSSALVPTFIAPTEGPPTLGEDASLEHPFHGTLSRPRFYAASLLAQELAALDSDQ